MKPTEEPTEVDLICKKIQTMIGERMDKLEKKIFTIEKRQTVGRREILQVVNTVTDHHAATLRTDLIWKRVLTPNIYQWTRSIEPKRYHATVKKRRHPIRGWKRKRDCTSAVHGIDQNVEPSEYIDNLIKTLAIGVVKPKAVKHVGNGEKRPLIVTFQNTEE